MKKIVLIVSLIAVAGVGGFFLARMAPQEKPSPTPDGLAPTISVPEDRGGRTPQQETAPPKPAPEPIAPAPDKEAKENYDRHYAQGLVLLADKKYADALAEFQQAKAAVNTVEAAAQIEQIQQVLADDQQAAQMVQEIERLRQAGDLDQASQKAAEGVEKYWGTASGRQLADLKRAIDADAARQVADKKALAERKFQQAQGYYQQNDLRNAYLVLEDAVQFSDAPQIAQLHDDAKSRVDVYDSSLAAADAYMKNPDTYEDAIASLETAQKAWDTQDVRRRMDEAQKALAARRDRIAVVDFETKGQFDVPDAGGALSELLLPRFQGRFDLIERSQLRRILEEQNLQMTDLLEPAASDRLAKIKRLDYIVVGSVMRFGGVHVTARLVQVNTGLIDRTGKVTAPDIQNVDSYLDDLAAQLTMAPEEYQAYLAAHARPAGPEPVQEIGFLPPSQVTIIFENVSRNDFDFVDEGYLLPEEPPATWREEQFKQDLYRDIMALGMEFMAKGQYYEAGRQFEMALRIYPDDRRAMGLLAQAYRGMNQAPPPVPERERLAVFDFMAFGDPGYPYAGRETADLLASYFRDRFDVVDRYQMFWYMRRWHVSLRDLMRSRQRLVWFGRAFGIRYFVMGYLMPAGSFDVVAQVVDTQTGLVQSRARMRVHDGDEMRFRMADFSHALFLPGGERMAWIERSDRRYRLLSDGQTCMRENKFAEGMRLFGELMNILDPDRDRAYLTQARRHYDEAKGGYERSHRPEGVVSLATNLAQWGRERKEAEREAEVSRRKLEAGYRTAMDQGNAAMAAGDYAEAMRAFAAAMGARKTDEANVAYLKAKKLADDQQKQWDTNRKAEKDYAAHMESGRKKLLLGQFDLAIKEFEAAMGVKATPEARTALDDAKRQRDEFQRKQETAKAEKEQQERINRAYTDFMAAARKHMKQKDYQEAAADFAQAVAMKKTPEAEAGLQQAQQLLTKQEEQAREEAERRRREAETAKPEPKQPEAPKLSPKDEAYARLMKDGKDLMEKGEFAQASRLFGQAYGVKRTDEAKAAYDEAINKIKTEQAKKEAERKTEAEESRREKAEAAARQKEIDQQYSDALAQGKRHMQAREYDKAVAEYERALGLKNTPQAQALLDKARTQAAEARKTEPERKPETEKKPPAKPPSKQEETYARLMAEAKALMEKGDHAGAARLFGQAYGVKKTDEARSAYQDALNKIKEAQAAEQAKKETEQKAREEAERQKKTEETARQAESDRAYDDAMAKGEGHMKAGDHEKAIAEFTRALDIKKTRQAQSWLNRARNEQQAQIDAAKKAEAERKAREEKGKEDAAARARAEQAKTEAVDLAYQRHMEAGRKQMEQRQYRPALSSFTNALRVKNTPEAQAACDEANRKLQEEQAAGQRAEEERKAKAAEEARRLQQEQERKKQEAAEAVAQQAKIEREYADAVTAGKQYMAKNDYERAVEEFTRALKIKNTPPVQGLLLKARQAAAQKETPKPPTKEGPKPEPGKGPAPTASKEAAQVQERFESCIKAAGQVMQKQTYEEQMAEIVRIRNEMKAAARDWQSLKGLDPATNKALRDAYSNVQLALQAAEVEAKKARKK
ncbi:MAG: hypothetical protein AB1696_17345 [Planctomycetota bacterium]